MGQKDGRKGGAVPTLLAHLLAHPQESTAENGEEGDCGIGGSPWRLPMAGTEAAGGVHRGASPPNGLPS